MIFNKFPHEYQMDAKDCGPACLKIIAKYYGKYYSLQYLRDLCGITREGVSLLDISYAAEKIGLRSLAIKSNPTGFDGKGTATLYRTLEARPLYSCL